MAAPHDRPTVTLAGHLDGRCSAEVRSALHRAVDDHPGGNVVVDVSRVESIDLTAMRTLAACAVRVHRAGHRMVLRGGSRGVRRLLACTQWRPLFRIER